MPSWQEEYLAALQERDRWEKADAQIIQQYTTLADRTADLEQNRARKDESADPSSKALEAVTKDQKRVSRDGNSGTPPPVGDALAAVRKDLAEAQRSRGLIDAKLQKVTEELVALKIQSAIDGKRIRELSKEKATLTTGLKDRDEELRGKRKLLENMHDETVSMTLQLNMADERSEKLQKENKDLVDRWMKKMAQEADAMNNNSKF